MDCGGVCGDRTRGKDSSRKRRRSGLEIRKKLLTRHEMPGVAVQAPLEAPTEAS